MKLYEDDGDTAPEPTSSHSAPAHGPAIPIISLWQPWAWLFANGKKRIETRHWHFPRSMPCILAVHAAKKWDRQLDALCDSPPFRKALYGRVDDHLAFGAVIGVVRVARCVPTELLVQDQELVSYDEVQFGDYRHGRFGWVTDARMALAEPVPLRGHQGIWQWEPTPEVRAWIDSLA